MKSVNNLIELHKTFLSLQTIGDKLFDRNSSPNQMEIRCNWRVLSDMKLNIIS